MKKKNLVEIESEMKHFQEDIKALADEKKTKVAEIDRYADSMKAKWQPSYLAEYKKTETAKVLEALRPKYNEICKRSAGITEYHLGELEKDLEKYFTADVSEELYRDISMYGMTGAKPTENELRLLCKKASNYKEMRFVDALIRRTYEPDKDELRADANHYALGDEKGVKNDVARLDMASAITENKLLPDIPDIDTVYKALHDLQHAVHFAISDYTAGDEDLFAHLTGSRNPFFVAISSDLLWRNNMISQFNDMIDKANMCLNMPKRKLTEKETAYLHALFRDKYRDQDKVNFIAELCSCNKDLKELVQLSPEYSQYLIK